jgi:hypothetical protein
MARTAVIAGTAQATANAVNRRQASKNTAAYQQAQAQYESQQPTYAPPPQQYAPQQQASGGSMDDKLAQLERLSQLKAQGILSEQEFAQQKAAILG